MQKNDELILDITDIASDGSGIARHEDLVIFVPLSAVGDRVRAKLLKVKKSYAYAKIEEIISPSGDRAYNDCEVFSRCGGCVYRHISYEAECRAKYNRVYDAVKRIGGIDMRPMPIIPSANSEHYRNKAQYPISQNGEVGFFAARSHRIIENSNCALQPEIFGQITNACTDWIKKNKIKVYDESQHKGILRHIYIRHAEATGQLLICFVINGEVLPFSEEIIENLKILCGDRLRSVQININREKTNVILGKICRVIYGSEYITDILCGVKIRLSPLSFYQVNRSSAEKLYQKAAEYALPDGRDILDLYCGAGTIGLSMANRAKSVIGVEIIPEAVKDAEYNAEQNGIKNASFICADAAKAAEELAKMGKAADTVIIDPPRKGCDEELIKTICKSFSPQRVVYVSCDPATLARDLKLFCEFGYALVEYTPVDMFPRTAHVETVCLLSRKDK